MKTVYDYLIDYYESVKIRSVDDKAVKEGIRAYLVSQCIDPDECSEHAVRIAERELVRLKMMPVDIFEAYFENYDIRNQISMLESESEQLAICRVAEGETIAAEIYQNIIRQFYEICSQIAGDKRYSTWIQDKAEAVTANLKYATGITDSPPVNIQTRLYMDESSSRL